MNIDPSVSNREVLIRYLETSGVANQKEAAKLLREDDVLIARLKYDLEFHKNISSEVGKLNGCLIDQNEALYNQTFWQRLKGLFK